MAARPTGEIVDNSGLWVKTDGLIDPTDNNNPVPIGSILGDQYTEVTATLAEINAGKTLLSVPTGKKAYIRMIEAFVTGNWTTGISIEVEDSEGSPVNLISIALAGLQDGDYRLAGDAYTNIGAGYSAGLTAGSDVVATVSGSPMAGGTSILFKFNYSLVTV